MLSKRLLEISKLVDKNKTVFDVGSDHGLLPCFLVKEGICPKAYAGDNKIGPLNHAKETIARYGLEDKVIPVLSDGIEHISDDVDEIVIAGMGFHTVKHILDGKDLSKYEKIIVQINKDTNLLRDYINQLNYSIIDEIVIEDDFFYEVVVFNTNKHSNYSEKEIKYGPILLDRMDETFVKYLNNRIRILNDIYMKSNNHNTLKSINEIKDILG